MKRHFFVMIMIVILTACGDDSHEDIETVEEGAKVSLYVASAIEQYSPVMSSVPGLPMEITCGTEPEAADISLVVSCSGGTLIIWKKDGTIVNHGTYYSGEFESTTLYWTPIGDSDFHETSQVDIRFSGHDQGSDIGLFELAGSIYVDDEGYYVLEVPPKD